MILKDNVFRAYDIRGGAYTDFDEDGMFVMAQAFGQFLHEKYDTRDEGHTLRVLVTGDGRQSQQDFAPAVEAGLQAAGCDTVWGGTVPTPVNFFGMRDRNFDGSIQLSASHNPASDNGLKLTDREGSVCGEEIQKIKKFTKSLVPTRHEGVVEREDAEKILLDDYTKKIKGSVNKHGARKIVIDAGNGISGMVYPQIYREFGHEVVELFCDLDTSFPNHQPDPERPENMCDLISKVPEVNADFGFGFDGDGDRVGVVLGDGTLLSADKILFILAADYLHRHAGASIIVDAMCSATLIQKIRSIGGHVILSPTGHSFIEEVMHDHGAKMAGEQSGHFMFGEDFYGHDDACLAGLRFLAAVEKWPALIPEVTKRWPDLVEFNEKFEVADDVKFGVMDKLSGVLVKKFPQANLIDGVRIDWEDGEWAIIRCSNTSPKIVVRIEALDEDRLELRKDELVGELEKFLV